MIYIILIILIIIIWWYLEYFTNDNLKLLSKYELSQLLLNDTDNYYKRFSSLDLKVRNINSIDEYKNKISNIYYNCNSNEYNKILKATNKINTVLKNYNIIGFDGNVASNIKWKIGIVNGDIYENGLPHTRNDVIIISNNVLNNYRLINVLLHEKIHIYQKLYPNDIQKYLINNKFVKSKTNHNNIRANPDIDEYIYKNENGQDMLCKYNQNPNSILDVTYYPNNEIFNEHPFEYMAYNIENILNKKF